MNPNALVTEPKYAVLAGKGGSHQVIERREDVFGKNFYVVIADAADGFEAQKIARTMNAEVSR